MTRIWAVARQTIAEGVRMKVALVFIAFILLILGGLPFVLRNEDSVSSAVQTFLSFSLAGLNFFLCLLTIFLTRSLSEEIAGGQILLMMAKPVPRWQFVVGKWLGIVTINGVLLVFSGLAIFFVAHGMAKYQATDEYDKLRLRDEILTARHGIKVDIPDFRQDAEDYFNDRLESGGYSGVIDFDPKRERNRLLDDFAQIDRTIYPLESRDYLFSNIRCDRTADRTVQVRYEAEVWAYPPDEILRCVWVFGDLDKGTSQYVFHRRDVIARRQSIFVPADAIAADRTLKATLINQNPFEGEPQFGNTISFTTYDVIEMFFPVGTFGGNLARQLTLVFCRLMLLAAFAMMAACLFSFPVACLMTFCFIVMASMTGYLSGSLIHFESEGAYYWFKKFAEVLYSVLFFIIPDFSRYDGASLLVNGRNVTLMWVLTGIRDLVLIGTTAVGLLACILFQRREVAETSF